MRLHIFEPRYQIMIRNCLDERQPFGVVLIRRGLEASGPLAEPYSVGCTADILQVERLSEGRMNLVVVGGDRFRIHSLDTHSQPYLTGQVEDFPLVWQDQSHLKQTAVELKLRVSDYLQKLMQAGLGQYNLDQLPESAVELAWLGAALVQVQPDQKQGWLESSQAEMFLDNLLIVYRRELVLLEHLLADHGSQAGPFSQN